MRTLPEKNFNNIHLESLFFFKHKKLKPTERIAAELKDMEKLIEILRDPWGDAKHIQCGLITHHFLSPSVREWECLRFDIEHAIKLFKRSLDYIKR